MVDEEHHSGDLFDSAVRQIEAAYSAYEFTLGWRFLYTPRSTLKSRTRLWFIGLNPGGKNKEQCLASCEGGNAYRVEKWPNRGPLLQKRVCGLFELIAWYCGICSKELLDTSLCANIVPFRTQNKRALLNHCREKKIDINRFIESLWGPIFRQYTPVVIVCMSQEAQKFLGTQLSEASFDRTDVLDEPTFYGRSKWHRSDYSDGKRAIRLVRIPHLSRHALFVNEKYTYISARIAESIAHPIVQANT